MEVSGIVLHSTDFDCMHKTFKTNLNVHLQPIKEVSAWPIINKY